MFTRPAAAVALALALAAFSGCATPKQHFLHSARQKYQLSDEEIKQLQLFVSTEVLIKTRAVPEDNVTTDERTVVVPAETPGLADAVGPDWVRVKFDEDGSGVTFRTDPAGGKDGYYVATAVEGKPGLHILADLPEKVLVHDGRRWQVHFGTAAKLLVSTKDLQDVIDKRKVVRGVEK